MEVPNTEELSKLDIEALLKYANHEKKEVSEAALNLINERLDAFSKELDSIPFAVSLQPPTMKKLRDILNSMVHGERSLSEKILGKAHPVTKKMNEVFVQATLKFRAIPRPPRPRGKIIEHQWVSWSPRKSMPRSPVYHQDTKSQKRKKALSG